MRSLKIISIFFVLFCSLSVFGQSTQAGTIVNPVLPGDRPDPTVIKIGNEYWAAATSNEWSPLFPIFKSTNLVDWELVNYVFPDGAPQWASHNFWAPELSYDEAQKKLYLHYTARDKKSNRLSCAVAVADSPMGKFKDLGPLVAQAPGSIDSYEVRDENGKLYLLWKEDGNSKGLPTDMWAQELTEDRKQLVGEMKSLFKNDVPWEEGLVEGVCVVKRNGYFYAFYSAASCCDKRCNYKTGVARSKKLLGPWEKNPNNPILVDNADWRCPGHGTIVNDGTTDYYLYHAYNRTGSVYVGRQGVLEQVYWTADWPYFKNDAKYDRKNESLDFVDTFNSKTLAPIWQWRVTQKIKYSTGKDGLLLQASTENKDLGSLLVQPIKALKFSLTADVALTNAAAGIAIIGGADNGFGAPLAGIGVSASKNKIEVWKTVNGKTEILATASTVSDNVAICMTVKDGYKLSFTEIKADGKPVMIADNIDASPYVPWGMGFRIGLVAKGLNKDKANFKRVELKNFAPEQKADYTYRDVPFTDVKFNDNFVSSRIQTLKDHTIPFAFQKCEETGRVNNFAIAGGLMQGKYQSPYPFDDTDVYKIMEGAAYLLAVEKDAKLDKYMDSLIYLIGKAQEPDGYLYTNRTINNPLHPWAGKVRWEDERDKSHELYNAGHMYEAAVAHYLATGKRSFLDIAIKNADFLCKTFGPNPGQLMVAPGHQEVELALVKLYRVTGNDNYLKLSKFFLDARGKYEKYDRNSKDIFRSGAYWQDHLPLTQQFEAMGHAVRAVYTYIAMADISALEKDAAYLNATDKLWENVVGRKMYITGGIGSTRHGEAFEADYLLPNKSAYCETCASIANCMWNLRMFMLHGESKYIDVMERSMYNGVFSGIGLDGKTFFYPNVLSCNKEGSERSEWFDCSCCPSNLARFMPSIPGYAYATSEKGLYVNMFGANEASIKLHGGSEVKVVQETQYPWDGKVKVEVSPAVVEKFDVMLRIPGWAENMPVPSDLYSYVNGKTNKIQISVNGKSVDYSMEKGYAVISKLWRKGDVIEFTLPMDVNIVKANEKVEADRGFFSVERGPLVYCAEFPDNKGESLNLIFDGKSKFDVTRMPDLFDGVNVLTTSATRMTSKDHYKTFSTESDKLTMIPYYARSHRGLGDMTVWMPSNADLVRDELLEIARVTDKVLIGSETSEKQHKMKTLNSSSGGTNTWRDANNNGFFSYVMTVDPKEAMEVVLTFNSRDGGNREFEILVDGKKIADQRLRSETFSAFIDKVYTIPTNLTRGKKTVEIKIQAMPGMIAGGIFGIRTQRTLIR